MTGLIRKWISRCLPTSSNSLRLTVPSECERQCRTSCQMCSRLARVREVQDVTMQPHIEREMALIDVEAPAGERRQEVLSLVGVFRAKVVDISHTRMIIEASGNKDKVEAFIELLRPLGIHDF